MMEKMAADLIRRKLAELSDDELLAFVKANLFDALNHVQLVKLQELVNTEVGMEEWFVNVDESSLRLTAFNLDLTTLQKVQGVFSEAEVGHRRAPPIPPSSTDPGVPKAPSWMRSGRHG